MKTTIIIILCLFGSIITFGQNQKTGEQITSTPPEFMGIKRLVPSIEEKFPTIESYLRKNVTYPERAKELMQQGTEVVKFMVTTNGEIANIKIINSVSRAIDEEVIRTLFTTNGMWKSGQNNGIPGAMEKVVSIVFKLEDLPLSFYDLGRKYFTNGAKMLFKQQNAKKALKYFDKGLMLLPNETGMLALRGLSRFELGDKDGALRDWIRIKNLGGLEANGFNESLIEMNGYAELKRVLGN